MLIILAPAAVAGGGIKSPVRSWVVDQHIPEPQNARLRQIQDGVYGLLLDKQIRMTGPAKVTQVRRLTTLVTERAGLERAATVSWYFEPTHQWLDIHSIRVLRGGRVIDPTDRLEFTMVRRETGLERGMLDDYVTAHSDL